MTASRAGATLALGALLFSSACARPAAPSKTQRLVDLYRPELVVDRVKPDAPAPRLEWRFDGPAAQNAPTRGWRALNDVGGLSVKEGRLVGLTTDGLPLLHLALDEALPEGDGLQEAQVRLRVSGGTNVAVRFAQDEKLDDKQTIGYVRDFADEWSFSSPLVPGDELRTYVLRSNFAVRAGGTRHIILRPTDAKGARFEIESIRLVTRREHLQGVASGVGWQGLGEVYKESLVTRSPERIEVKTTLPAQPWLDLAVGSLEEGPVTFRVDVVESVRKRQTVLERTVTRPHHWETTPVDLAPFAGRTVTLSLALETGAPGGLGLWGSPVIRSREPRGPATRRAAGPAGPPPQGVIVIWADTLRRDHLGAYGYERPTSPFLDRLAREGSLFKDAVSQASWTKVSTPSFLTSLYPSTHGVKEFQDRLPSSAVTLAEAYREAGYATLGLSSVLFIGKLTNLHQGFEELHEDGSLPEKGSSKTAREYVDRLSAWLETHRDGPFFAFLHVTDPHDPYKPRPPYDTLFADASKAAEHERQLKEARKFIADPLMKLFGMPTRAEMEKAGIDAERYVAFDRDWYDGSIRGLDAEVARLFERLRALGLDRRTLVAFTADHGEEFLEHGRMFHGQNVYGHQNNVPLILWQPGLVPAGREVDDTVQSIDVMPTLLEASGVPVPAAAQGRGLWDLMTPAPGTVRAAERGRAAVSEKALTASGTGSPPPHETASQALVWDGFKLIENPVRKEGAAEFELYDHRRDPLDRHDLASQKPEVVERMARELRAWRKAAEGARLKPDAEAATSLSRDELERLRALGYIQ